MSEALFSELENRAREISDLYQALLLATWDMRTGMPPGGAKVRPYVIATLSSAIHARFVDQKLGLLLERLGEFEATNEYDSYEASLIRVLRADREREVRVPVALREERTRLSSEGYSVWTEARRTNDFKRFAPLIERQVALARQLADYFEVDDPYDALLDEYEPGLTAAEIRALFADLKAGLLPLIAGASSRRVDDAFMDREFDLDGQREIERVVLRQFGLRDGEWRLDTTAHPFALYQGTTDIRLSTRYERSRISLFYTMHESGHGLYEHNIDPSLERTPLCRGASFAFHESQSRTYENLIGRSASFWEWCYPHLQRALPDPFRTVELDAFLAAVNRVRPSLIRASADEATYGLHIILRFELEELLLRGELEPAELPSVWNARMREYLGVEVPDDAHGVLQDTHWSRGFGQFPLYAIGNIIAAQLWDRVRLENPDIEKQFAEGDFQAVGDWMRRSVWRHGRKFTPRELLERIVGGRLDAQPYLSYLIEKYGSKSEPIERAHTQRV